MTTDENGKKFFVLLIAAVTFLVLGSFVVSFDITHFIYLIVLYIYIYRIYRCQKSVE